MGRAVHGEAPPAGMSFMTRRSASSRISVGLEVDRQLPGLSSVSGRHVLAVLRVNGIPGIIRVTYRRDQVRPQVHLVGEDDKLLLQT